MRWLLSRCGGYRSDRQRLATEYKGGRVKRLRDRETEVREEDSEGGRDERRSGNGEIDKLDLGKVEIEMVLGLNLGKQRDRLDLGKVEIERVVGLNLGKHR
ncbi:hypothetical protein ACFX2I_038831 [Malus domestica]